MDTQQPDHIEVRGAKVHNLKDIDVDILLHKIVGIAGGRIVAAGTPENIKKSPAGITGRYL